MRGKLSENLIIASESAAKACFHCGRATQLHTCHAVMTAPIIFVLASFAFVSLFGISMGMEARDGQQMSPCPFMASEASLCQMSVTEHISQWQQAFLGVPSKTNFLALALLLAAAVLVTFAKSLFQPKKLTELAAWLFAYHKEHLVRVCDPLLIAFSDGILNSKIYEPARI